MTRLEYLRSHLLPPRFSAAGTPMSEVPPDFVGLSYSEYLELQWLEYCESKKAHPLTHPDVLPSERAEPQIKIWKAS